MPIEAGCRYGYTRVKAESWPLLKRGHRLWAESIQAMPPLVVAIRQEEMITDVAIDGRPALRRGMLYGIRWLSYILRHCCYALPAGYATLTLLLHIITAIREMDGQGDERDILLPLRHAEMMAWLQARRHTLILAMKASAAAAIGVVGDTYMLRHIEMEAARR